MTTSNSCTEVSFELTKFEFKFGKEQFSVSTMNFSLPVFFSYLIILYHKFYGISFGVDNRMDW